MQKSKLESVAQALGRGDAPIYATGLSVEAMMSAVIVDGIGSRTELTRPARKENIYI